MSSSAKTLWAGLRGDPALLDALTIEGPPNVLPSRFGVTTFAATAVGLATLAASELLQARTSTSLRSVRVDTVEACAAFRCEALFEPIGWKLPPIWDPIAGDYYASDRWIRLHTNYAAHRAAALQVLGTSADRSAVEAAVARWDAARLEEEIVAAGGCAAVMYTRDEWMAHPHGAIAADEPAIVLEDDGMLATPHPSAALVRRPLEGLRVLDITRVLAGPICTRFLAAHGAEVLRIDPPGFEEVPAIVPEVTAGKRCTALALDTPDGAAQLDALLERADVLVHALRPGSLERLGFDRARLRAKNPALIIATHDAYGWRGPWRGRRGFDSLVQMSTGIAAPNGESTRDSRPSPLPAQALDHGTGFLVAAGICRALALRTREQRIMTVRGSLIGAANHLLALDAGDPSVKPPSFAEVLEETETFWGAARRVRCPGLIDDCPRPSFANRIPGPLGRDTASFQLEDRSER